MKRILVFALALMVMAMPIGLAEAGYGALTLSNFHLDVTGMEEPLDVDATLKIGVGGQDDATGRVDIDLTGGGQPAFSGSAGFDAEKVQAIVGGSNYYFEIPMAELEQMIASATEGQTGSMKPEDYQKIQDLITRYIAIATKYSDPAAEAKLSQQILPALNAVEKGKEATDMFGESMELNRYDIAMTGEDIGKIYQAMFDADPEIKALMNDYFTLLGDMSGEKIPFTADSIGDFFATTLKEQNVEMKMDFSIWSDTDMASEAEAKAVKEVITVTVTAPKTDLTADPTVTPAPDAKPEMETVSFPMTFSMLTNDAGTRAAFNMDITPPDESGSLSMSFDGTFDAPAENGGTASTGAFNMAFTGGDETSNFDSKVEFSKTVGSDNVPQFNCAVTGTGAGQQFDLSVGYAGATATETEQTGTVTIDFNVPEAGKGSLAFDVKLENSEFKPLTTADLDGKTKVDPLSADEKLMEEVNTEMGGVMMQAVGVLMQTPGLSNIMGGMMNSSGMAG